jgi:hypothetical protein
MPVDREITEAPLKDNLVEFDSLAWRWAFWFESVRRLILKSRIEEIKFDGETNGDLTDQVFHVATRAMYVEAIFQIHSTLGTDGSAVNVQVVKDTGTTAPGAGTNLLTDNSGSGFNLKATINTVQEGSLTTTKPDRDLAKGDRLSVDFSGTLTAVTGVKIIVRLKAI